MARPPGLLLARTFALDVLLCPSCQGRMQLLALVTAPAQIARYLRSLGEDLDVPPRSPARGPPYWKRQMVRRTLAELA